MRFDVRFRNEVLPVDFKIGNHTDVGKLRSWGNASGKAHGIVADALEYARHAVKRWRSYQKAGRTLTGLGALREAVHKQPRAEFVFVLIAHDSDS